MKCDRETDRQNAIASINVCVCKVPSLNLDTIGE